MSQDVDDERVIGKRDEHTGVRKTHDGFLQTFEHAKGPLEAQEYYEVVCRIHFTEIETHENTYYVPGEGLDFFLQWITGFAEEIKAVRPVSKGYVEERAAWFKGERESKPEAK